MKRLVLLGLPLALVLGVAAAIAYFSTTGSGKAAAVLGSLSAPAAPTATAGAGTVALSWTVVSAPTGNGTVSYYVQRDGATPGGDCPTSAVPSTVTSCTDSGLSPGTYHYTVTAVWRSWSATSSSTTVTLTSGALHHFALSAATTTPVAGAADNLTITAKDSAGNTVTTYGGDQTLTFSGASSIGSYQPSVTSKTGAAVTLGTAETITFTNGVAAVSGSSNGAMTLYKAESATITVSDGTHTGNVSVTVGPASAGSYSVSAPSSATAGSAISATLTAKDTYGNTATGYAGSHTVDFSGPHSSPGGTSPSYPASVNFTSGAGSANVTLYDAETTTLAAADHASSSITGTSGSIVVGSGTAASLSLSAASTTPTAGVADNLTVTARDTWLNTATGYTGSKSLTFSGANSIGSNSPSVTNSSGTTIAFGSTTAITFTSGVASVSGSSNGVMKLYKAETAAVVVSDGSISNGSGLSIAVGAAVAGKLAFTQQPSSSTGGIAFGTQPKVTVQDTYGNAVTTDSSSVTLAITSGTGTAGATLTCTTNPQAASAGVATFAGCKIDKSGTGYTLTATDGSLTSAASSSFNITVGPAAKLGFVQQPAGAVAATAFTTQPKVAVQDAGGNTVTTDTSLVTLSVTVGTGTTGAVFTCTSNPLAASSGVASFAGCKIDKAGLGYTLTAVDGTLTSAVSSSFTVSLALSPAALPGADVGTAYSQTITASGGTSPYTFTQSSGSLPSGLTLSSAGVLSGTPAAGTVGTYTFTVTATDSASGTHNTGSQSYTLYVYDATTATTKSATGTSATTSSFTLSASTTYVVFAYAKSGTVSATITSTFTGSPAITQLGSQQNYNNNAEHAWAWYLTGGASNATGTITVSFGAVSASQAYLDVVKLSGNSTSTPIVTSNEGFHTITGTTQSSTAACDLPSAPTTGDYELAWFSSGESVSTPTSSNSAITSIASSHQAATGGTVDMYGGAAQQTESLNLGANHTWGTISLEINHP